MLIKWFSFECVKDACVLIIFGWKPSSMRLVSVNFVIDRGEDGFVWISPTVRINLIDDLVLGGRRLFFF